MTRFAGDGKVLRLGVVAQRSGQVVQFEARRVQSRHEAAQRIREAALEAWLRESSAASFSTSDYQQLHGYTPHLTKGEVADFAIEAVGHLLNAHRCPDGDPAQERNLQLFHQRITDALLADAEAAGR